MSWALLKGPTLYLANLSSNGSRGAWGREKGIRPQYCAAVWTAQRRRRGLWREHRGFSWGSLGAAQRVEHCAPPRSRGGHQAQSQTPALSSHSPARVCCLHPTEALRTLRDPAAPGKSAAAFIPVIKLSAGPAAHMCPAKRVRTFGLWTGRHFGSAVVWAKFNLSHAREHQLGLYPAEGSRRLLIFT